MRALKIALVVLPILSLGAGAAGAGVVERFARDPLAPGGPNVFHAEGDAAARFAFLAGEPEHFPGDRAGTLRVLYDTTLPGARLSTPVGGVLSPDDDFVFGAILTIRPDGFSASPDGFSQIAFGLWNSVTTGAGRTAYPSDAFDLIEFDYFPNVGPYGGPFLSPTVFGGDDGSGNAFSNLAFRSIEQALPLGVPLLCEGRYTASDRRLEVTVSRHARGVFFAPVAGADLTVDLSTLRPGFLADVLGIAAYFEGWASLRAEVDYDLIYFGDLPHPFQRLPARMRVSLAAGEAEAQEGE